MLAITILSFVFGTLYAFLYENYRRQIRHIVAVDLNVPGCYYWETDSDASDEEVEVVQKVEEKEGEGEEEEKPKVSVLARFKD